MAFPFEHYPPMSRLFISHSSREITCDRKFEFYKLWSNKYRGKDAALAPDTGKALHAGFQEYLRSNDTNRAIIEMLMAYPVDENLDPRNDRSMEACYASLMHLIAMFDKGQRELVYIDVGGEHRPAIEVPFQIDILNFDLRDDPNNPLYVSYIGYVDAYLFDKTTHRYGSLDVKSTRWWRDTDSLFLYDEQQVPYGIVLQKLIGEPIDAFDVEYAHLYLDLRQPKVEFAPYPKTTEDIQDWAMGLYLYLSKLKVMYQRGWFERNAKSCNSFKKVCTWFDICRTRDVETIQNYVLTLDNQKERPFEPWVTLQLDLGF